MIDESRQFIDTNIIVYAYDQTADYKHNLAKKLIDNLWRSNQGCLSIQVLQEFHNVVTRKIASPLSLAISSQTIDDFSVWHVHVPEVTDVINAIKIQDLYQISFWDALIIQSANYLGCEIIWSEDLNHDQKYGNCKVQNPFK